MELADLLARDWRMVIGGQLVEAVSGERFETFDPGTGKAIVTVPRGGAADIDLAVASAREAFDDGRWSDLPPIQRVKALWRLADVIEEHIEDLANLDSINQGSRLDARMAASICDGVRYYAGFVQRLDGRITEVYRNGEAFPAYTRKEPIGVAALITPWNSPLAFAVEKVVPALAAGCTVVLKPAEETPLTGLMLGELCLEAGIPAGVVNVVTGFGAEAGAALSAHPDVDKLSFTGSTEVGRILIRASADSNLKKLTLELGGKSPNIIFDDADLSAAIPGSARAVFANAGQICSSGTRLFVQDAAYDEVVEGIAAIGRSLKLGYWSDPATEMGPLISQKQLDRVAAYVEGGIADGARAVTGGRPVGGEGYFFEPTVLVDVRPDMKVVREEIFGPVVVVQRFSTEEEVIAAANDTDYGLSGAVWSGDVTRGRRVVNRIRTARIGLNTYPRRSHAIPFGGYKQSGWGYECGPEGVDQFLQTKGVYL